jgi:site-specific DNA-methyltransferase (adenine-specific)
MALDLRNVDCMELMSQYPDKYFDLAIVDPPYGIDLTRQQKEMNDSGKVINGGRWKKYKSNQWDLCVPNQSYFDELFRVSKNQIIWGGNFMIEYLSSTKCFIIWNKIQRGQPASDGELAWTSFSKPLRIFDYSRIDAYVNDNDSKIHPAQKPVKLYKWLLENYAKEGDKILDTHLGSGSIAIACHDYKFDLVASEIDKEYFYNCMKRVSNHLAQTNLF